MTHARKEGPLGPAAYLRPAPGGLSPGSLALVTALALLSGCGERQAAAPTSPAPPAAQTAVAQTAAAPAASPVASTLAGPAAVPATAAAATARPTWTLMVTWMSPQQPAATSQTVFHDAASCEKARLAALAEGARLQTEAQTSNAAAETRYQSGQRHYVGHTLLAGDAEPTPEQPPTVAAFCAAS